MVDNLLLYNGPSQDELGTNIVTMNETEDQLRFDIIHRGVEKSYRQAIVLTQGPGRLTLHYSPDAHLNQMPPHTWQPVNIFADLNRHVLDPSAHKVYRKAVFKMLRKYTTVDSFTTLVEPEKAIAESMYPIIKDVPLNDYSTLRKLYFSGRNEYLKSLRQLTVQQMAKVLFGQKRYRKDLVKALAEANSVEFLTFLFTLKREVPVDWFINILRNNPTLNYLPADFSFGLLQRFYDSMSDKQFRKFCKCLMEEEFVPVQSIMDMAEQFLECREDTEMEQMESVTKIKFRNLEEFHYWIGKHHEATSKERERREKIERYGGPLAGNQYYDAIKAIDFSGANYEVVVPEFAYELVEWGSSMNNCIGGYATRASKSDTDAFVAIKAKDGTMKANILMSNNFISQFFGKKNSSVDKNLAYDFNMRLILGEVVKNQNELFGTHFRQISSATGLNTVDEIKKDFANLGVSVDEYISLRRP